MQPKSNLFTSSLPQEFLDLGFLKDHKSRINRVTGTSVNGVPLDQAMILDCLKTIPSSQTGRWSLVGDHPQVHPPPSDFDTIYLDLLGQFPVPADNIPLSEIIAFHKRHREDLIEFRNSLAELSQKLTATRSEPAIRDLVKDNVQTKLDDIEHHLNRSIGSKILEAASIGISVPGAAIAALLSALGLPAGAAFFVGNSTRLSFAKSLVSSRKLAPDCHYVLDAHKAGLFGQRWRSTVFFLPT